MNLACIDDKLVRAARTTPTLWSLEFRTTGELGTQANLPAKNMKNKKKMHS